MDLLPTRKEVAGLGRLCLCVVWICLFAQLLPHDALQTTCGPPPSAHQHLQHQAEREHLLYESTHVDHREKKDEGQHRPRLTAYEWEHHLLKEVGRQYKEAIYLSSEAEAQDENAFLVATLAVGSHYLLICFALWVLLIPDAGRHTLAEGL